MNWKTRGRIAGLAIVATSFISANADQTIGPAAAGADNDPVVEFTNSDTAMNAAQEQARRHLDRFLSLVLDNDGIARDDAAVKVAVPVGGDNVEVIWITPFAVQDGMVIGALANEPRDISGVHLGDVMTFAPDQVRDWAFTGPDGRLYGSYTTRIMLDDLDPGRAAEIALLLSPDPVPPGW